MLPSITLAAKAAGIERTLHYRRYKSDPVYKEAFDEAWEMGVGALEDDATEKAVIGHDEPLSYKGELTGDVIKRHSDALLMFLLRGAKPEKYRERHDHSVNGNVNVTKFKGTMTDLLAMFRDLTTTEDPTA